MKIMHLVEYLTGMSRGSKRAVLLSLDFAASQVSLACLSGSLHSDLHEFILEAGLLAVTVPAIAAALGLQNVKLTAYEQDALPRSAVLAMVAGLLLWLPGGRQPAALAAFMLGFLTLSVGLRLLALRVLLILQRWGKPRCPVIIYGAGETGVQLALALRRDRTIRPVALIDDQAARIGQRLAGLCVRPPNQLESLRRRWDVRHIIIAMPSEPPARVEALTHRLRSSGFTVRQLPSFAQFVGTEPQPEGLMAIPAEAYLSRTPVHPDLAEVARLVAGKTVLVTGAGGSIGSELCRHLIGCGPAALVLLDHSEAALYAVDAELREAMPDCRLVPVLGSIADATLLKDVLACHSVHSVIHAAAYKHVPIAEANPAATVANNVIGTRILAECCAKAGVRRFVLISTDKAVRPVGVMGASKRLAEIVVQDLSNRHPTTKFSIVRFGNVLGSSGSVVPLFRQQIERGGPVTITHPDVTRFFMTPAEAARLVLAVLGFSPTARAGIYVLDMGQPLRIAALARRMIEEAGLTVRSEARPDGDIEIRVTGLRPGEKLHEELLIDIETRPTQHPRILRANEAGLSPGETSQVLQNLRLAIADNDAVALRRVLFDQVEAGPALRLLTTQSPAVPAEPHSFRFGTVASPKNRPAIDAAMQHRIY